MRVMFSLVCMLLPMSLYAMADYQPPVYGRPTLYGEYEVSADTAARHAAQYGTPQRPRAIAAPAVSVAAAKRPVRPPKAGRAASGKKKKTKVTAAAPLKQEKKPADVIVVPPRAAPAPRPVPKTAAIPREYAVAIVEALRIRDVDSFCARRAAFSGTHPRAGLVIMPGRPDLMSCGEK